MSQFRAKFYIWIWTLEDMSLSTTNDHGVLLELYRSDHKACKRVERLTKNGEDAQAAFCGDEIRYEVLYYSLPPSPTLRCYNYVPTIVYVPRGGEAVSFARLAHRERLQSLFGSKPMLRMFHSHRADRGNVWRWSTRRSEAEHGEKFSAENMAF